MTAFVKGQKVTLLSDWDRKGGASVKHLVVASCGKKQMVLMTEDGLKYQGKNFEPQPVQYSSAVVFDRLTNAEAEVMALRLGQWVIAREIAHCLRRISSGGSDAYIRAITKQCDELQSAEPSVIYL